MIDFEAELDRLAADLAVLDVACGAGTRVNWRLEALAAIRIAVISVAARPLVRPNSFRDIARAVTAALDRVQESASRDGASHRQADSMDPRCHSARPRPASCRSSSLRPSSSCRTVACALYHSGSCHHWPSSDGRAPRAP